MIKKVRAWLRAKEEALNDQQRLRLMIGLYVLLLLFCAVLVYAAWKTQSTIPLLTY